MLSTVLKQTAGADPERGGPSSNFAWYFGRRSKIWAKYGPQVPSPATSRDERTQVATSRQHVDSLALARLPVPPAASPAETWAADPAAKTNPDGSARPRLILVLDGIQYPTNMGSLLQSAHAFGFDSVLIVDDGSAVAAESPEDGTPKKSSPGRASCSPFNWKALDVCGLIPGWRLPYRFVTSDQLRTEILENKVLALAADSHCHQDAAGDERKSPSSALAAGWGGDPLTVGDGLQRRAECRRCSRRRC